ncbi:MULTISPECIES: hypothetical protein [unclassified Cryobacterium]|uniref:hypothetical protein n=1 Tax=unclassified Cryobacterium TaxID=2649013 RepID=UPI000CE46BCB|nr:MULTISPECIES: hypothetical protein [unclassified Cryobacterium]
MTTYIPDPEAFFRDINAGIWKDIRQFFPADECQAGMLSTLTGGEELRSAHIFTDASGVPYFRDAGNLMFSINDIERAENVLVIASTYNEALSDVDDDTLGGAVFTHMAWVCNGVHSSPVSVGLLRQYLGKLIDARKTARHITHSSFVKGWEITGEPGGR